jgi:lysophospholipid acyltransferase (LPLAT)-like uncharacterized protein
MKLRHPWLLKSAAFLGARALRLWMATLRYQHHSIGPNLDPNNPQLAGRYIYAMWHENMLLPVYQYSAPHFCVLLSQHGDAQIMADILQCLRVRVVRGSTTRGGAEAVRAMLRAGRDCHLALTPDGPRGPRQKVKPGVIYLAARLGMPIVPVGFGFQHAWRLNSWDRFALPRPFTRATCVTAAAITVPDTADRDELERYRQTVEDALVGANDAACHWAETGTWLTPAALKGQQFMGPPAPQATTADAPGTAEVAA